MRYNRSPIHPLRRLLARVEAGPTLFGALLLLALGVATRLCCGSPYPVVRLFRLDAYLPPLWLVSLLSYAWLAAIGGACGAALGCRTGGREGEKYRAGMLFVILSALIFMWYKLLFGGALLLLSIAVLAVAAFLCFLISRAWARVLWFSSCVLGVFGFWLLYGTLALLSAFLAA